MAVTGACRPERQSYAFIKVSLIEGLIVGLKPRKVNAYISAGYEYVISCSLSPKVESLPSVPSKWRVEASIVLSILASLVPASTILKIR